LGENDDYTVSRLNAEDKNWVNPLSVHDDGNDDDVVILQTDGSLMTLKKRNYFV
jgi:hypothetical protein